MDLPIEHQAFSGRGLALRPGGFFKGPRLLIDGSEAKGKRLKYLLRDNSGNSVEVRLKSNGLDPIPKVQFADQTIALARPLTWYEYAWMSLPILLVFAGGGLGALFGLFAVYSSTHVFRGHRSTAAKFGLSAVISLGAALAFFVCAVSIELWLGKPSGA